VINNYQVIIIGAGPAGSYSAYKLARCGIKTLVLEKEILPRDKCCAGGLTVKTAELLNIDMSSLAEDVISRATVSTKGNKAYYGISEKPFMCTVTRRSFDDLLVKRALEAGAEIKQNVSIKEININDKNIRVTTNNGEYLGEFLIGADGAESQVRKAIGMKSYDTRIVGLQVEVKVNEEVLKIWKSRIGIDIGIIRGGYGWLFPKSEHLTIGVVGPEKKAKTLRRILYEYLDSLELGEYSILERGAGLLPVCTGKPIVSRGRAILVGDAAGLVDPLTGEGLYNAVFSAGLGAEAIEKALKSGNNIVSDYDASIGQLIIPQMKIAGIFSKALALMPSQLISALHKDINMWRSCCDVLCGNLDYVTIKDRVSSLSRLYKIISHKI
jgi:geranylgeranyl reductase family protein